MMQKILAIASPLIFAAIGGLFSEISGTLNIALEGFMLLGAFLYLSFTVLTQSALLGALAALAGVTMLSLCFAFSVTRLKANAFIAGMGFNLLIAGLVSLLSMAFFKTKGVIRLSDAMIASQALRHGIIMRGAMWGALLLPFLASLIIEKTPAGLRMRTAGRDPEALRVCGVRPEFYRGLSIVASSILASFAGILLSLRVGAYVPNLSAGRGWIALALIYLGNKKPLGVLVASLLFSGITQFANSAQGYLKVPDTLLLSLPQGLSVLGLSLYAAVRHLAEKKGADRLHRPIGFILHCLKKRPTRQTEES